MPSLVSSRPHTGVGATTDPLLPRALFSYIPTCKWPTMRLPPMHEPISHPILQYLYTGTFPAIGLLWEPQLVLPPPHFAYLICHPSCLLYKCPPRPLPPTVVIMVFGAQRSCHLSHSLWDQNQIPKLHAPSAGESGLSSLITTPTFGVGLLWPPYTIQALTLSDSSYLHLTSCLPCVEHLGPPGHCDGF